MILREFRPQDAYIRAFLSAYTTDVFPALVRAAISRKEIPDLRKVTSSARSTFFLTYRSPKVRVTVGGHGSLVPGQLPPFPILKNPEGIYPSGFFKIGKGGREQESFLRARFIG